MSRADALAIVKQEAALGYSLRGKMRIAYAYVTDANDSGLVITADSGSLIFEGLAMEAYHRLVEGKKPPFITKGTVPFEDVYEIKKMRGGGWVNVYAHQEKEKFMLTTQATGNIDQLLIALHALCPNAK